MYASFLIGSLNPIYKLDASNLTIQKEEMVSKGLVPEIRNSRKTLPVR